MEAVERAARWDIVVQQGSTWQRTVEFPEAINVSEFSLRGQIRRSHSASAVLAEFFTAPAEEGNAFILSLAPHQTEAIPAGNHVFDVELFLPEDQFVLRILEGKARVTPEVTR